MKQLVDFKGNGFEALESIIQQSEYKTIWQALASLTVFASPKTIEFLDKQPMFPTIRIREEDRNEGYKRGSIVENKKVMLDDNDSPTRTFIYATNFCCQPKNVQFNHIYSKSDNVELYTNLANLCVTPTFLAKLTDEAEGRALLKWRAFELFDFAPQGTLEKPSNFDQLQWAEPLPELPNLEKSIREKLSKRRKDRLVTAIRELGWVFSKFKPDLIN